MSRLKTAAVCCAWFALISAPVLAAEDVAPAAGISPEKEIPLDAPTPTTVGGTSTTTTPTRLPFGATFAGVNATGPNAYWLRLTNRGPRAGQATVTLLDAARGTVLGTWTSPSLPVFAAQQVSLSTIAAQATPALTAAQIAAPMNMRVSTSFAPAVQLVTVSASAALSNVTACGGALFEDINLLGYVEGPGTTGALGVVRIVNTSSTRTSRTKLTIYNAANGASLGTWTSPDVPPNGSVTTSMAAIAAAAMPVIPATTAAVTIVAAATRDLRLEHAVTAGGALADLTSACSP